ncbi:MAG: GWxTD domain-containing protein, partial [Patescibacteria group bacterium]|nr:GWxTD domain-containing protein [Patescibacteria group bacterium]
KALRIKPNTEKVLEFLAQIKERQGMSSDAAKLRERTIKKNPAETKNIFELLQFYIVEGNKEKIRELQPKIEEAVKKNPKEMINYLTLGQLQLSQNHLDTAITVLNKGLKLDSTNGALHKSLSEAYVRNGQGDAFTEEYYIWLEIEKDPKVLDREYAIAELCMSDSEVAVFKQISFQEKPSYLIRYWRERDPYPVTIQNERLIEHFRRILYSERSYRTAQGNLGFDDRGKVYVRWGEPDGRFTDPVPGMSGEFLIRANESWYYPSYGINMGFDFVNIGGYYQEVPSLIDAFVGNAHYSSSQAMQEEGTLVALQQLYQQREHLGGIYHRLATEPDKQMFHFDVTAIPTGAKSTKRSHVPRFEFKLSVPKLEFIYRTAQFRGDSGKTLLEFAYGVPIKQLEQDTKNDTLSFFTFQTDFVLMDTLSRRNLHIMGEQKFVRKPGIDYADIYYLNAEKNQIFPSPYKMSFQILEANGKKADYCTEPIRVRDYRSDTLMISDLKFSQDIHSMGFDSTTGTEKLSMLPYPFSFVHRNKSIFLYFEVYNLSIEPGTGSKYRISLKAAHERQKGDYLTLPIRSIGRIFIKGKPQIIESMYERDNRSIDSNEYIELDLSGFEQGNTRLTVTVIDLVKLKKVENSIDFNLKKE